MEHTFCNGTLEECEHCVLCNSTGDCIANDDITEKDLTEIIKED
jgi:hypothetical protein